MKDGWMGLMQFLKGLVQPKMHLMLLQTCKTSRHKLKHFKRYLKDFCPSIDTQLPICHIKKFIKRSYN